MRLLAPAMSQRYGNREKYAAARAVCAKKFLPFVFRWRLWRAMRVRVRVHPHPRLLLRVNMALRGARRRSLLFPTICTPWPGQG
jgi:hypothetical protein